VRLKSFIAPSMADAMAMVREALGDDAVIVGTREEDDGVRITAAIDEAVARAASVSSALRDPVPDEGTGDVVDTAYETFRRHGLPATLGETLLERVGAMETREPAIAIAGALRQTLGFAPLGDEAFERPIMLVGPPGAGKTQTTAKLAARGLVAGRGVSVLTTDTERTGGVAPLEAFMNALRLDLLSVETPDLLRHGLEAAAGSDHVLVDSAGRNHLDEEDLGDLGDFLIGGPVEPVLVLPAGVDPVEASDIASAFADFGVRRMIATRLDMTRRLGSILAAAWSADLAIAEFGRTPRLKGGLTPADPRALARLLLPSAGPYLKMTGTDR